MIWRHAAEPPRARLERGQASLMMLAVVGAVLAGRGCPVRPRKRARREGAASAGGRSCGDQRRAGDARPVSAAVRAAVPRAGRAESPAPGGGGVPRIRRRRRDQGRQAERRARGSGRRHLPGRHLCRHPRSGAPARRDVEIGTPDRTGIHVDRGRGDRRDLAERRRRLSLAGRRGRLLGPARLSAGRADAAGRRARVRSHGGCGGARGGPVPHRHERLSLGRGAGAAVRRSSRPEMGGPAG